MTDRLGSTPAFSRQFFMAVAALLALSSTGEAGHRFVSGAGSDGNPCTFLQPCRGIQRAVDVAVANDEVHVLNSTGYGPSLNITKSVSIIAVGVDALLGPTGITINAPSGVVTLEGLHLAGFGTGASGIVISGAAAVHIRNCTVERFTSNAIKLVASTATKLFVSDTVARDNGGGLFVDAENAQVVVENTRFERNSGYGAYVHAARINITRSTAAGNGDSGILTWGGTANITETLAANNTFHGFHVYGGDAVLAFATASGNATGLNVGSGAAAIVTDSVFTRNDIGINNSGALATRENNTLALNALGNYTGTVFEVLAPF